MWPCMRLKHLEQHLQSISTFEKPKIVLEQYVTPPHLSSNMLYTIQSQYGDLTDRIVADLGCGCGGLTIGTAILDVVHIIGFEIDNDALDICQENIVNCELNNIDLIQCDIVNGLSTDFNRKFDTVIMNPPFGTKNNTGIDMKFLQTALRLTTNTVYSLHKTSTRPYIMKIAENFDCTAEVLAELHYDLPATYKFHKKKSVDIEVDFFRFAIK